MAGVEPRYVGIDGCPGGWVCVGFQGGGRRAWQVQLLDALTDVPERFPLARRILIDIPIGLAEGGSMPRECDRAARQFLGRGRGSSVFPTPVRPALKAPSYQRACRVNEELTGKRLSRQTWGICPKIDEADRLLRDSAWARDRFHESHPEVCFRALAKGDAVSASKRTELGFRQRLILLSRWEPRAAALITAATTRYRPVDVGRDDVVDALCLAIVARARRLDLRTLPAEPPRDPCGLPMEMVFGVPRT